MERLSPVLHKNAFQKMRILDTNKLAHNALNPCSHYTNWTELESERVITVYDLVRVSGGWFVPVGFTDEQHDAGTDADEEAERRAQTHGRHLYHRLHTQVKHNTSRSDIHSQPISA